MGYCTEWEANWRFIWTKVVIIKIHIGIVSRDFRDLQMILIYTYTLYCTIISLHWTATAWFFGLLIGFLVKKKCAEWHIIWFALSLGEVRTGDCVLPGTNSLGGTRFWYTQPWLKHLPGIINPPFCLRTHSDTHLLAISVSSEQCMYSEVNPGSFHLPGSEKSPAISSVPAISFDLLLLRHLCRRLRPERKQP